MSAPDPKKLIAEAVKAGATFAMFMEQYAAANPPDEAIIQKARDKHHVDGELEIDDVTITSGSDGPGDYVLAWVWVDKD